jgi:hypothetical protein
MRFWVYFVKWFMANRLVLFCIVDKYRANLTKSATFKTDKDKEKKSA